MDEQGAFLMRGLDKVRAEFSLTALAYNLRRAINLVGVQGLIRAVRARSAPFRGLAMRSHTPRKAVLGP
jgi:hypothetical protein